MASSKYYAYYIRGRQIAIVQHDYTLGSGQTLSQPGLNAVGARGDVLWKSPTEDVASGLEIEYAYSPRYTRIAPTTTQIDKFYINGWTVQNGYLTFVRSHSAGTADWTGSPYSSVANNEYITISGSERWNGLHKVQSAGADGTLVTYTRVNKSVPVAIGSSAIDIFGESGGKSLISANDASNLWLNNILSAGEYLFLVGSATAHNNGFWKVDSVADDASTESASGIYVANRYYCYDSDNTLDTEGEDTSVDTTATTNESVTIYKAYRDFCYLEANIDALDDESDTIDLPEYLAKALVYYVKAKIAEDRGELEQKEYNMREFKRLLERNESSKIWGARRIGTDETAIR